MAQLLPTWAVPSAAIWGTPVVMPT